MDSDYDFIDEVGCRHSDGLGWSPDGDFCGECGFECGRKCGHWQKHKCRYCTHMGQETLSDVGCCNLCGEDGMDFYDPINKEDINGSHVH